MLPRLRHAAVVAALVCALCCAPARATYSIVACDAAGDCGAAVATHNLAVGASVIYAQAKVGAVATQFETNPQYGPKGLALLARGVAPADALRRLLEEDGGFDGGDIGERQVGLVDARGRAATHTGAAAQASAWAGARSGEGFAVQGNGLASAEVLEAMAEAYRGGRGDLSERLMAALRAGQRAGGQRIGAMSAALRVATVAGGFQDIDLRVDGAADPVADLARLDDQFHAHQAMLGAERAARRGDAAAARAQRSEALRLSHQWDRIWRRAARLAMQLGEDERALEYLGVFASANPVWAREEVDDALYVPLRQRPQFVRLREGLGARGAGG
ncbi:Uncharacterized conserved protein, Ntn-hydrolase superfamily [Lysobacter sp. yr284]|uniref:DUF1028 domain-containing protein n=1 Tax=Lysobacter sp. yr284 TaxID=1761791 RepID=UPI000898398F|nr:DUF1028 domain-containing protein [Lysobacter sp. yr284]SDY85347.1 Uncharacterized conserved protein, Ntn-hydrolase superfamily [Lysobacter sp. yr284]